MAGRMRNAEVRNRSDELTAIKPVGVPRRRAHVDEERWNPCQQSLHEGRAQSSAMIDPGRRYGQNP